jgi:4-diphosphocytidyl-2C-methyl-D-erythritol kinase
MSGSGSSVFGLFESEAIAKTAAEQIASNSDWKVFQTRLLV